MSNHDAGRAIAAAAIAVEALQPTMTKDEAMAALTAICEQWRGCNVEFDVDALYHGADTALSRLVARAFASQPKAYTRTENEEGIDDWDNWYDDVYVPFRNHFEFI